MLPISLVAYLILFILVGVLALFVSLLIGRFIRPSAPSATKGESYECGEPSVGSSYIQFDLRFYVVALLFIIFEVELAFFFPPSVVFGKVNELRGPGFGKLLQEKPASPTLPQQLTAPAKEKFSDLGIPPTCIEATEKIQPSKMLSASNATEKTLQDDLSSLALMALLDIGVFFVVLLVGFAFLWKQGDLNWVRAIARPATKPQIKLAVLPNTREAQ